ncbi:hypothetical protein [Spiroplasma endosymbiont of Othius punctulatus]|uniref:hypothetical protein n=1 Tax=Spiroplasma endosymbiont of Othius punctulatus TaxID=3066289 RepID=UPI0030CD409B
MKKLLLSLTAIVLTASSAATVVSCNYIDTVEVSVKNKINEVVKSTSHFFKPAILANLNNFYREDVETAMNSMKISSVESNNNDTISVKKQLNMFFDQNHLDEFSKINFDQNTDENYVGEKSEKSLGDTIKFISGVFDTVYGIIGEGFSPRLIQNALEFIEITANTQGTLEQLNNVLSAVTKYNPVRTLIDDLQNKEITFSELKLYTQINFVFLLDSLMGGNPKEQSLEELMKWNKGGGFPPKPAAYANFKKYATSVFSKIIDAKFSFNNGSIKYIIQMIYGIGWTIQSFDKYVLDIEDVVDDNHLFSITQTNMEVFNEVNSKFVDTNKLSLGISSTLSIFIEIFNNNENDKNSYDVSRILKILFQVDNDTNLDKLDVENTYIEKMNLSLMILPPGVQASGQWGKFNNKFANEQGLFVPILNLLLDSIAQKVFKSLEIPLVTLDGSVSYSLSNLISSALANNNIGKFFTDFSLNPGWIVSILNENGLGEYIDPVLEIFAKVGEIGILDNPITQLIHGNLLGQIINLVTGNKSGIDNISDLMNIELFNFVKVGEILSRLFSVLGGAPDLAFKLQSAIELVITKNTVSEYEFRDALGIKQPVGAFGVGDNPTDLIIGARMIASGYRGVRATHITNPEEDSMTAREFAFKMLGITNDGSSFIDGGLLGSISKMWDGDSGDTITTLMSTIKKLLGLLSEAIPSSTDGNKYKDYLDPSNFSQDIISYNNFIDSRLDSEITYQITYRNQSDNTHTKYEVELVLPKRNSSFEEVEYKIINFRKIG